MEKIADVYELKSAYCKKHPDGHFFDRDTLRFFGETLSGMYLSKRLHKVKSSSGDEHLCYELSSAQRYPSFNGGTVRCRKYHYFDAETLDQVC